MGKLQILLIITFLSALSPGNCQKVSFSSTLDFRANEGDGVFFAPAAGVNIDTAHFVSVAPLIGLEQPVVRGEKGKMAVLGATANYRYEVTNERRFKFHAFYLAQYFNNRSYHQLYREARKYSFQNFIGLGSRFIFWKKAYLFEQLGVGVSKAWEEIPFTDPDGTYFSLDFIVKVGVGYDF